MASNVGALTQKRKRNLQNSGRGRNSANQAGLKPSGPDFAGFADMGEYIGSTTDTWVSLVGGAALATFGILELINRRSKVVHGVVSLLGAGLLYRGIAGLLSPSDGMKSGDTGMENPAASVGHLEGIKVEESVVVNCNSRELYDFWRDFSNLPQIMNNLESVEMLDDNRSRWTAKGPLGTSVDWDAEVYMEKVGEMISWRSMEGSQVETAGSVQFDAEGENRTKVTVMMKVDPPLSNLGIGIAKIFGDDPETEVKEDLKNFKKMMEAKANGTGEGQSNSNGFDAQRN